MNNEPLPKVIVRLKSSSFCTDRGVTIRQELLFMKRQCEGHNFFEEDCKMVSPEEVTDRIINLRECRDGVYEIVMCNASKDWETGYADSWDYRLVKAEPKSPSPLESEKLAKEDKCTCAVQTRESAWGDGSCIHCGGKRSPVDG